MESLKQVCSLTGIVTFAIMSWMTVFWTLSPFIAEAASAMHQTYGF